VVYVTHDQVEAMTLGTKVAVMREGVIQQIADPQTIYERPANMFVAGFIGSPTMNFLTGTLERVGTVLALKHGSSGLPLGGIEQDVASYVGREVVAGIRPESLSAGAGPATLNGTVDVVEPTGPDTMVIVNVGGQLISARLGSRDRPKLGEAMALSVDTAAVNLFDPQSGNRI
jgi:multiple sugar transport system ATP-binding protein